MTRAKAKPERRGEPARLILNHQEHMAIRMTGPLGLWLLVEVHEGKRQWDVRSLRTGKSLLLFWPETGRWWYGKGEGESGTCRDWRKVIEMAGRREEQHQ